MWSHSHQNHKISIPYQSKKFAIVLELTASMICFTVYSAIFFIRYAHRMHTPRDPCVYKIICEIHAKYGAWLSVQHKWLDQSKAILTLPYPIMGAESFANIKQCL